MVQGFFQDNSTTWHSLASLNQDCRPLLQQGGVRPGRSWPRPSGLPRILAAKGPFQAPTTHQPQSLFWCVTSAPPGSTVGGSDPVFLASYSSLIRALDPAASTFYFLGLDRSCKLVLVPATTGKANREGVREDAFKYDRQVSKTCEV